MQVAASDDSGTSQNAAIKAQLQPGRRYVVQVRTNYAEPGCAVAFSFFQQRVIAEVALAL
jgi:hypothetical protein